MTPQPVCNLRQQQHVQTSVISVQEIIIEMEEYSDFEIHIDISPKI